MTKQRKLLTHRINLYFKKEVEDLETEKDFKTNNRGIRYQKKKI